MSDKAWCEQNGINVNSFYTSVKRLKNQGYTVPAPYFSACRDTIVSHEIVPLGIIDESGEIIPGMDTMLKDQPSAVNATMRNAHADEPFPENKLYTQPEPPVITLNINGNEAWIPSGVNDATIRCIIHAMRSAC